MKKILASLMAAVLAMGLVACGSGGSGENSSTQTSQNSGTSVAAQKVDLSGDPVEFLKGKRVGAQQGTTGDSYATELGCQVMQYSRYADAITALSQGKVDAVVIDEQPAMAFMNQKDGLAVFETPLVHDEMAIAVKKGNSELLEKLNQAIATLEENGTLQAIYDKYITGVEGATGYTTPEGTESPNGKLIMATNATFPPYEYLEGEEIVGYDPEVSKAICDLLGYELEIVDMEFDGIFAALNSGKADFGAAGFSVTPDRAKTVDFTNTYYQSKLVCMVQE